MPDESSLLAPGGDQQPELLPVTRAFVARLEADGDYTGERLFSQRPAIYKQVVLMLSAGHGSQFIADTLRETGVKMSKNTVKAVRKREGDTIDLLRERLAGEAFEFAAQADEAATLILSEIMESRARRSVLTIKDVQALKQASSMAITSGQLLTGRPTAHIAIDDFTRPTPDLNEQLAAHIAGLKDAATHSVAEKKGGQISETAGDAAKNAGDQGKAAMPPAALVIEVAATPQADGQSPVQPT